MNTFQRTGCGFSSQCPRKTMPKKIAKSIVGKSICSVDPRPWDWPGVYPSGPRIAPPDQAHPGSGRGRVRRIRGDCPSVVPFGGRAPIPCDGTTGEAARMKSITVSLLTDPTDRSVFYRASDEELGAAADS